MSKRGRLRNRERRALAANPGGSWIAARAAEQAIQARDDLVERYQDNPMLHLLEAGTYADAISSRSEMVVREAEQEHGRIEVDRDALRTVAHILVTGTPLDSLPIVPTELARRCSTVWAQALGSSSMPMAAESHRNLRAAHQFITANATALKAAETYVLSPAMHAAVCAAANTLTADDFLQWAEADVLCEAGFVHLPYTQIVDLGPGRTPKDLRAISWRIGAAHAVDGVVRRSLKITGWVDVDGPVEAPAFSQARRYAKQEGFPFPGLIRDFHLFLALDQFTDPDGDVTAAAEHVRSGLADTLRDASPAVLGEFAGDQVDDPVGDFEARYLFAFMRLADQKVSTVSKPPPVHDNGLRTRSTAHDVRVVQLRTGSAERLEDAEGSGRKYRHRWVVRMHKVRQWYPSEGRHKVIWRGPYIAGPEGAPLLAGEKVQALVR